MRRDCSAGFCSAISTISVVKSSLMDAFITIRREKSQDKTTSLHESNTVRLRECIERGRNVLITGGTGVGKTFLLNTVLDERNSVLLEHDHLRGKHSLMDFLRGTGKTLVIEDYSGESHYKAIVERAAAGERLSTRGLVVTSSNYYMWGKEFEIIHIEPHSVDSLMSIMPNASAAERSGGNVRNFLSYARDASDDKDVFQTPKEFVHDILCAKSLPSNIDNITEHGHMYSIMQENYASSKGVDVCRAAIAFSDADIYDTAMYQHGHWQLMPFFAHAAMRAPMAALGEPLNREKLRAGSFWTKDGNARMRMARVDEIARKAQPLRVDVDSLNLLHLYAAHKMYDRLYEYKISAQNFDVMNHLAGRNNRLRAKDTCLVKRALKQHAALGE